MSKLTVLFYSDNFKFPFEGNTERSILKNTVEIVNKSLPINKVVEYYKEVKGAARDVVLGYVTFTNAGKDVSYLTHKLH